MPRAAMPNDLRAAAATLASMRRKIAKARLGLKLGSAQEALARNRLKALRLAEGLVRDRLLGAADVAGPGGRRARGTAAQAGRAKVSRTRSRVSPSRPAKGGK